MLCGLQCVQYLFFYLFQLVFHLHHNVLHLGLIALRASGVDLSAHLLCYEAQLLTLSARLLQGFAEIFQVVSQALLLFANVELLDIINQFLLKAVLIILNVGYALQAINNAGTYLLNTSFLPRLNAVQQLLNVVNLLSKLLLKGSTLLLTEVDQFVNSLFNSGTGYGPLSVRVVTSGIRSNSVNQSAGTGMPVFAAMSLIC